ncbi:TniQ family protein [Loktanella sp. DJP18]|uniref:TniQ family protein n=1 Tax=Loktanella sp. DJP18 TaxID=3409788 RepID=UPI003BB5E07B
MTGQGCLPVVFPPENDERLSSWIARLAPFYAMTVSEFVSALGLQGHDVFDLEWRISDGEEGLIAARTGLSREAVQAMTFRDLRSAARMMVARMNRYTCLLCPEEVHHKSAALPWKFRCPVHGLEFRDVTGAALSDRFGRDRFKTLEGCGVHSGRGQNDTLRVFAMSFHDIEDGIFVDAEIPCNPTI